MAFAFRTGNLGWDLDWHFIAKLEETLLQYLPNSLLQKQQSTEALLAVFREQSSIKFTRKKRNSERDTGSGAARIGYLGVYLNVRNHSLLKDCIRTSVARPIKGNILNQYPMCTTSRHYDSKFAEIHNPVLISLSEHYSGELVTAAQVAKFTLLPHTVGFSKGHYEWLTLPLGLDPAVALTAVLSHKDPSWTAVFRIGPHTTPNEGDIPLFPKLPNRGTTTESIIIMTTEARISTCYNVEGSVIHSIQFRDPVVQTDRATWALGLAAFCHQEGSSSKISPLLSDEWLDLLDDPHISKRTKATSTGIHSQQVGVTSKTSTWPMDPPRGLQRRDGTNSRSQVRQGVPDPWESSSTSAEVVTSTTNSSLTTDSYFSASTILHSIETRFAKLEATQQARAAVQDQRSASQEQHNLQQDERNRQFQALLTAQNESNIEIRQQFVTLMATLSQITGSEIPTTSSHHSK